jgi:hypothetical protein
MSDWIDDLDDATAMRVLGSYARAQPPGGGQSEMTPPLRQALADTFGGPAPAPSPSPAELARQALRVLAMDKEQESYLRRLATGQTPQSMVGLVVTVGVVTAALLVLQTQVEFNRDKDGRWSLKIKRKPTSEALLQTLARMLFSFTGDDQSAGPKK